MDKYSDGESVRVNELMNKVTLNIIGLAGFGFDFTAFSDDKNTSGAKLYEAFSSLITQHSVLLAFIPILKVRFDYFYVFFFVEVF